MRCAGHALSEAKRRGRDRVVVADDAYIARLGLLEPSITVYAVKQALLDGEISLDVQPIVYGHSGALAGVEALIRWRKRDGTVLSPYRFLAPYNELISRASERELRFKIWRDALPNKATSTEGGKQNKVVPLEA